MPSYTLSATTVLQPLFSTEILAAPPRTLDLAVRFQRTPPIMAKEDVYLKVGRRGAGKQIRTPPRITPALPPILDIIDSGPFGSIT